MARKMRLGILFGGMSAEHEVSLQSARNIIDAVNRDKYEVLLIGIDKKGRWHLNRDSHFLLNDSNPALVKLAASDERVVLLPNGEGENTKLVSLGSQKNPQGVDVIFPVLHGPYGEDGTVQGLLKLSGLPFVGADVAGSAVGMDKDLMKRLLKEAGIPVANFIVARHPGQLSYEKTVAQLGLPIFLKPANLGSSVGISMAHNEAEFKRAVAEAFQYDTKVLAEEAVHGREIECAVLGNDNPQASLPGEVIPKADFYSYRAKYLDQNGAVLEIPANLNEKTVKNIQRIAVQAFQVLCCQGMARVDFFLKDGNEILVNEINTIPGFTRISMYPKLWEASGISYAELIDRLIELALKKFERERGLKTSVEKEKQ